MPDLGPLVRLPNGITVRRPPAAGVAEAFRLRANGYTDQGIAKELTRQGYANVKQGETAKIWADCGEKIAAKRAETLGDPVRRRIEQVTRYLGWLAEIDGRVRSNGMALEKAMPLRIKTARELDRVATGEDAAVPALAQLAGGRYAIVDLLGGISDQDVMATYLDEHGSDPEQ